jgi:hypothetical protein
VKTGVDKIEPAQDAGEVVIEIGEDETDGDEVDGDAVADFKKSSLISSGRLAF